MIEELRNQQTLLMKLGVETYCGQLKDGQLVRADGTTIPLVNSDYLLLVRMKPVVEKVKDVE